MNGAIWVALMFLVQLLTLFKNLWSMFYCMSDHIFQLAVTDSLTGLNNTKFVTIVVKAPSLDYIVNGDLIIDP